MGIFFTNMENIYYSEELECYILQQEEVGNNRYVGLVLITVKDLSENEVINKLLDKISEKHTYSEHYKKILDSITNKK